MKNISGSPKITFAPAFKYGSGYEVANGPATMTFLLLLIKVSIFLISVS